MPTWPGPSPNLSGHDPVPIFLRKRIGWNARPESGRPSLEDAAECVSGARVTGRDISRELGLPYIGADGIDMTRSRVSAHGGEVVEGSHFSSWMARAGSQRSATRRKRERQDALRTICRGRQDNFYNPKSRVMPRTWHEPGPRLRTFGWLRRPAP
jgi:hypothetical protein